jgi:hypothetical protein
MDDDKTLKALLKEEKRRREKRRDGEKGEKGENEKKGENKREKSKHREHKDEKREKSKHRERKDENREKHKEREKSKPKEGKREERTKPKDDTVKFMFIFEDTEGKLYSDLDKIEKKEGGEIKIFPVYISGGNDNLNEETVTFTNGEYGSSEENSWLTVLNSKDKNMKVVKTELEDVVVYNSQFYHCMDDFIDYVELFGPDVLPLN